MATPLERDSYRVNTAVIPQLVDFLLDKGVKGLFVGGTTGEGIMLDADERKKLHEVDVGSCEWSCAGSIACGCTADMIRPLIWHAMRPSVQADAVAAIPPYFYGMHDDALAAHFQAIADAVPDMPLFGYDIPHMAVNGISPSLASRLCESNPFDGGF